MSNPGNKIFSGEFWKSRKGQQTFCVLGVLVSLLFLLWQFGGSMSDFFPAAGNKESMERELKKLQAEQENLRADLTVLENIKLHADSKFNGSWRNSVHGTPEIELRTLIEKAAQKCELRLNNISTVRKSSFNSDLALLEVDVSVNTTIDVLTKFLLEVEKIQPSLYWRRFDCRTSNMFGMSAVNFSGTLRCASDERAVIPEKNKENGVSEK